MKISRSPARASQPRAWQVRRGAATARRTASLGESIIIHHWYLFLRTERSLFRNRRAEKFAECAEGSGSGANEPSTSAGQAASDGDKEPETPKCTCTCNLHHSRTPSEEIDILNDNGILRMDMSKIIDQTGLPTYDAALKLESYGYVWQSHHRTSASDANDWELNSSRRDRNHCAIVIAFALFKYVPFNRNTQTTIYLKTFHIDRNLMGKFQFAVLALVLLCKNNNVMQNVLLAFELEIK